MADLTVTAEREKQVDFTQSWIAGVDEIVVASPSAPAITSIDDLSGKDVFVRPSSRYYQSLTALNERFASEGKPPVKLTPAPEELEDEDLMEMAHAGLVDWLVVDNGWTRSSSPLPPRHAVDVSATLCWNGGYVVARP